MNKYVKEIDENVVKEGKQWELWSGIFNRKLRKDNPDKFAYIFSYWQIQNAKKRDGNIKELNRQATDIKKIIEGKDEVQF